MQLKILILADDKSANTIAWSKAFQKAGCEVRIVSARANSSYENVIALGLNYLPAKLKFIFAAKIVKEIIEREKPDILIGYRISSYGYLASESEFHPLILAAQNEKIINRSLLHKIFKPLFTKFIKNALKQADLIHAWGDNIKSGLLKFGANPEKILVMHRGINLDIFKPSQEKEISVSSNPVIISTRSLYPEYKIDILIKSFAIFAQKYPEATLKIIGDGPEKTKLEKLSLKLKIRDKTVFYNRLDPDFLAEQLRSADLYVSLIDTEGISSSLIEACACGLLPIVTDMPASREIIENEKNGILINTTNPAKIAEVLINAYENIQLRKKVFELNPAIAQNKFDASKNIHTFIAKYKEFQTKTKPA